MVTGANGTWLTVISLILNERESDRAKLSRSCVGDNAGSFAGDRGLATRVVTNAATKGPSPTSPEVGLNHVPFGSVMNGT